MYNPLECLEKFIHKLEIPFYSFTATIASMLAFIFTYFFDLTLEYSPQYVAVLFGVGLDGLFGVIAGKKREGFKTYKALSILTTAVSWVLILTSLLLIEEGFAGLGWLSETILAPFLIFQVISTLKNASIAGFIEGTLLNGILDKIDQHKGKRSTKNKKKQNDER